MRELESSEDRRALLPGGDDRTFLALFYRSSEPGSVAARESAGWDPPAGFEAVAIDLDRHPELSDWFQLAAVPALAAVFDGSLLCVDHEIDAEACRRLIETARRQRALFLEMQT